MERTSTSVRLRDAFRVIEEPVMFSTEPFRVKGESLGVIEIPIVNITRWRELPVGL